MFDSFHQSFDGMSPEYYNLNRKDMEDVPGYSNSMSNHFNDNQWMLKALMSMDRSLLLLKAVMPSGEDGYRVSQGSEGFPEDEFANLRLSDLSHSDMEGLYRVLIPIEGNDSEHIRNPRWFDLSPHATMVHDTLMNSAGGHFNIPLAHAIMDEHNTRMEETPSEGFQFDQSFQDIRTSEPMGIASQLLKEYPFTFGPADDENDIEVGDFEETEYAQNPQWPHKNWMDSPQWPQLCDFNLGGGNMIAGGGIEGPEFTGCGRVIDGEEVTGLPMMSGHAICHDCINAIMPKPNITWEGAPELEDKNWQDTIETGEPMGIAFQLLKERKSPEAFAHKLEYDKKYQKNPKRVKYRVQLNRERRKRGIYGKGGKDVSHTQGNKLTLENPHSNRARHFKNRGTLRRVKVR